MRCVRPASAEQHGIAALFGLLLLTLRSWRLAYLALVPLVVGTLWTIGSMGLIGLTLPPPGARAGFCAVARDLFSLPCRRDVTSLMLVDVVKRRLVRRLLG